MSSTPERPARILLTGGTGFLGSHLAVRLLEDGHEVALLARPGCGGVSAAERVRRLMDWHGVAGAEVKRRLRVVEGELGAEALGLPRHERERLSAEAEEIVHCASETSFAERKRELLERVNLGGLARLLEFAQGMRRLTVFHHLSTAYVAGRRDGLCREEWPELAAAGFHNPYEETKCRAELAVRARCRELGVRAVVYRPSIVYGDSRTGRTLQFKALYHPARAILLLRDGFLADLRELGGERSRRTGVRLEADGRLRLPLRIEAECGAGLDLVPVDYFVDAFVAIRRRAEGREEVFHLTAGQQTPLAEIVGFLSRRFGLAGVRTASPAEFADGPRSDLEAGFNSVVQVYRPYMSDRRRFSTERSEPILARAGVRCPAFSYDVFDRCMGYAVEAGWGAQPVTGA